MFCFHYITKLVYFNQGQEGKVTFQQQLSQVGKKIVIFVNLGSFFVIIFAAKYHIFISASLFETGKSTSLGLFDQCWQESQTTTISCSIHLLNCLSSFGLLGAVAYPSCHWVRGRYTHDRSAVHHRADTKTANTPAANLEST